MSYHFLAHRDKARRHCHPKLSTAALLTIPPSLSFQQLSQNTPDRSTSLLLGTSPPKLRACEDEPPPPLSDPHSTQSPCLFRALTRLISSSQTTPEMA